MSTSIDCCFRGCRQPIWREAVEGFEIVCSSATCLGCRKMVLCVEHFEAVFNAQKGIACANCGGTAYWVCLFEPARLSPSLAKTVKRQGGEIEFRYAASAVATSNGADRDTIAGALDGANQWRVEPLSSAPENGVQLAPGIGAIESVRGTHLHIDGSGQPRLVPGRITHFCMSDSGELFSVEFEPFGAHHSLVQWFSKQGGSGVILAEDGASLRLGKFIDDRRIALIAQGNGRAEVREITIEPPHRARSRRIIGLEHDSTALCAPIPIQNREAVVFSQTRSHGANTVAVRLADSHTTLIADHPDPKGHPKFLAAAAKASTIAWIDQSGRIRAVPSLGQSPRLLGQTSQKTLAVAPSGDEVAWLEEQEIVVADIASGRITRTAYDGASGQLTCNS